MNSTVASVVTAEREILGHPRRLITLFFTEMWERLSYYGMRALLVDAFTAFLESPPPRRGSASPTELDPFMNNAR